MFLRIGFHVEIKCYFSIKSLHEINYPFCGGFMERKIFGYLRISTNLKKQKTDRQKVTLLEYAVANNFTIDEFFTDIITGGTKAENRDDFLRMKSKLRSGDIIVVTDIDRMGRDADDLIMTIKEIQAMGVKIVALDVPLMNDWKKMNDDSLSRMIIDIYITLRAHMAQQEKEKKHERVMQGLNAARAKGKKLGRPATGVPKEFVKEYNKLQAGEYGNISIVKFSKMNGIAVSTFYKYASIIKASG